MDRNQLESCMNTELTSASDVQAPFVSLESEIPEVLFDAMKGFIVANPHWDQYRVMSSALARFLYQNGSNERAVTERYLDDLFTQPGTVSKQTGEVSRSMQSSRSL